MGNISAGMRAGCIALLLSMCLVWTGAAEDSSSARAAYVMDAKTGRTLFAFNEEAPLPMASTTKVMTALLALENGNLDDMVETGTNAYGVPGTSIYLGLGEKLRLEEMLYGLMIASGNDAAVAIAEHIGGSVDSFAEMMTRRAETLGAVNTRFVTPHGLPAEGHYTTARDLTLIAAEAMKHPVFREIVSTQRASIPWEGREYMRVLKNKNALLNDFEGAIGIKTGFTRAAGRCLVFAAKRGEMEIIGVALNCSDWFLESARILESCFQKYTWTEMLPDGEWAGMLSVEKGEKDVAAVIIDGTLAAPLEAKEMALMKIEMEPVITAPLPQGTQVGRALMVVGDTILDEKPLVLQEDIHEKPSSFRMLIQNWLLLADE